MSVISRDNAPHYFWGERCDGWVLSPNDNLLVIEERMPPSATEQRHFHAVARQFFYVLEGTLTMEMEGHVHVIPSLSGIEIGPNVRHQARNESVSDVYFLVISSPSSRKDRTDVE